MARLARVWLRYMILLFGFNRDVAEKLCCVGLWDSLSLRQAHAFIDSHHSVRRPLSRGLVPTSWS
jgi:hypothetical protein